MTKQPSPRMRKVNELLREVIAEEVTQLKDPRLGFITITGVDTAPDLRTAVVYYSVLGSEDERTATATALASAASKLQAALASQARLKYTPRLTFSVDESIDIGMRMSKLLRELEESDG
ncbi:MAG TPA: 30S ribosome-binding factor RbfA [Acidimicrobiia bacterium]